jgi:glycosyltransferase involved in cell wall biosynthesis
MGCDKTFREIAELYKAADAYVAPYLGEGFNLPVLESMACGLPVICTAGGPTDDFTTPDCAMQINSKIQVAGDINKPEMVYLKPDQQHLAFLMREIMTNDTWREKARAHGPGYVREHFTWKHAGDKLEKFLLA